MGELELEVKSIIRDVPDFPKEGIVFKDITTLLATPDLNYRVQESFDENARVWGADVIVGIDSRGFLYGNTIASNNKIPFVPARKKGRIPYSTIEPIKQKLSSSYQSENDVVDSLWTQSMNEHVSGAEATAVVKLGDTSMSIGDLIGLDVGDILPMNQEVSGELSIEIEGVSKLKCLAGEYKGNRAVQITKKVN